METPDKIITISARVATSKPRHQCDPVPDASATLSKSRYAHAPNASATQRPTVASIRIEQASNKGQNKQMVLPIHCDVEILARLPDESLAGFYGPTPSMRRPVDAKAHLGFLFFFP
jgi:hypothetical protein